jgi:hypothetical protein
MKAIKTANSLCCMPTMTPILFGSDALAEKKSACKKVVETIEASHQIVRMGKSGKRLTKEFRSVVPEPGPGEDIVLVRCNRGGGFFEVCLCVPVCLWCMGWFPIDLDLFSS